MTRIEFKLPDDLKICACLGKQFNEPYCPCTMHRLGIPPSQERLDYNKYWNEIGRHEFEAKVREFFTDNSESNQDGEV